MTKELIKGKNLDGLDVEVYVVLPSYKENEAAIMAYNRKVAELIREGCGRQDRLMLRSEVEQYLIKMGIWTNEDSENFNKIQRDIRTNEILIRRGGIKLGEARFLALQMGELRSKLLELYAKRSQLDGATIEAVAENYKFNFLIHRCVFDKNDKLYFHSVEDYLSKSTSEIAIKVATYLAKHVYGYNEKFADNLFENKWLRDHKFIDEFGRLINKDGHLVDQDNRLIDEYGRFVDADGNLIDRDGNRVTEAGELIIESKPFLDDETGEPIQ